MSGIGDGCPEMDACLSRFGGPVLIGTTEMLRGPVVYRRPEHLQEIYVSHAKEAVLLSSPPRETEFLRWNMRILFPIAALCVVGLSSGLVAQTNTGQPNSVVGSVTTVPGDWARVKQLKPHTRVHLSTDRGSHLCSVDAVDDVSLTCSSGHSGKAYARAEIKSIKVTQYAWSTVGGTLIGAGTGVLVGLVCCAHNGSSGFGPLADDVAIVSGAAVGAVAGAGVGAATDLFRGPVVYRRPKS